MIEINTIAHNLPASMRTEGNHTRECFVGEPVGLGHPFPVATIEQTDGPGGQAADVDSSVLVCHEPGRYLFTFSYEGGKVGQLRLVACDRAVLELIPDRESPTKPVRSFESKALVLRSLSNHCDKFDGTRESLMSGGVSLQLYGA